MSSNQLQQNEWDERSAGGDLLVGAAAIRAYLVFLGMPAGVDPYYLKRTGRWPIGNTAGEGGKLIASKRRLSRHADEIARGRTGDGSARE
jgi:hypothetical protein